MSGYPDNQSRPDFQEAYDQAQSSKAPDAFDPKDGEWYTPSEYVEAARRVLRRIDLDPASCLEANETVKAKIFWTEDDGPLERPWRGGVFLNPPFNLSKVFVEKLLSEHHAGRLRGAVLVINGARFDAGWFHAHVDRQPAVSREMVLPFVTRILRTLPTPEDRIEWVQTNLPRSYAMLGVSQSWRVLGAMPSNGSGSLPRGHAEPPAPPPPQPRRPGRYKPKTCTDCGAEFDPAQGGQKRCVSCRAARVYRRFRRRPGNFSRALCAVCGRSFKRNAASHLVCSPECRKERGRETGRRWWQAVGREQKRAWKAARRASLNDQGGQGSGASHFREGNSAPA